MSPREKIQNLHPILKERIKGFHLKNFRQTFHFFYGDLWNMPSPFLYPDMKRAVEAFHLCKQNGLGVYIIGDKDVDGTTSLALLIHFFEKMQLPVISYNLPLLTESYGISKRIEEDVLTHIDKIGLLITVDCGIQENDFFHTLSDYPHIHTLILDHHTPGEKLPPAHSIINPYVLDSQLYEDTSGCFLAWKYILAIFSSHHSWGFKRWVFVLKEEKHWALLSYSYQDPHSLASMTFSDREELIDYITTLDLTQTLWFSFSGDKQTFSSWISEHNASILLEQILPYWYVIEDLKPILKQESWMQKSPLHKLYFLLENEPIFIHEQSMQYSILYFIQRFFLTSVLKIPEKFHFYTQLAAISTICDHMGLNYIGNHSLVRTALSQMPEKGEDFSPIFEFFLNDATKIQRFQEKPEFIASVIGPVLNASGRLGQAHFTVEFLLSKNRQELERNYARMQELNKKRRSYEETALKEIEKILLLDEKRAKRNVILISSELIFQGITGIIAHRIAKQYQKPCMIISKSAETDEAIGSARTHSRDIHLLNMIKPVESIFERLGGHPAAFGFTILKHRIPDLELHLEDISPDSIASTSQLKENISEHVSDIDEQGEHVYPIRWEDCSLHFIQQLELFAPFGKGNHPPLLELTIPDEGDLSFIGKKRQHIKISYVEKRQTRKEILLWDWHKYFSYMPHLEDLVGKKCRGYLSKQIYKETIYIQYMAESIG